MFVYLCSFVLWNFKLSVLYLVIAESEPFGGTLWMWSLKIFTLNLQKFSEGWKKYFEPTEIFCRPNVNVLVLQKFFEGWKKYFGATKNFCRFNVNVLVSQKISTGQTLMCRGWRKMLKVEKHNLGAVENCYRLKTFVKVLSQLKNNNNSFQVFI